MSEVFDYDNKQWRVVRGNSEGMLVVEVSNPSSGGGGATAVYDGFAEGKEFTAYYDFYLPNSASTFIKISSPINFFIKEALINIYYGVFDYELRSGGTESGTYSQPIVTYPRNSSTEVTSGYVKQVVMSAGGQHTGGSVIDKAKARSVSDSVDLKIVSGDDDKIALAAGSYYIKLLANGSNCNGLFSCILEERP